MLDYQDEIGLRNHLAQTFSGVRRKDPEHQYFVGDTRINLSVSGLISKIHLHFDADHHSMRMCDQDPECAQKLRDDWKGINRVSLDYGSEVHDTVDEIVTNGVLTSRPLRYIAQVGAMNFLQTVRPNRLRLVCTEIMMAHPFYPFCGTADLLFTDVQKKQLYLGDWKTNKQLEDWYGTYLLPPFDMYKDTNLNKYRIQLTLYAVMLIECGYAVSELASVIWLHDSLENGYKNIRVHLPIKLTQKWLQSVKW